jgi:MoaA/NifB/PqqE/SkfB family radical SAM enzyme
MQLIVKPTKRCNFDCTFCCAPPDGINSEITTDDIIKFLKRYPDTNTIIINGGDPLMMPPSYYQTLIDYVRLHHPGLIISLSTNLWDFYKHPDKWTPIFKQDDVITISTSFQYGEGRRVKAGMPFTEELFTKVIEKFKEHVGYVPFFICAIDESNEDSMMKVVELAARIGAKCRVNPMMKSGRQGKPYPFSKMFKFWLEVIDKGLSDIEFNSKQLRNYSTKLSTCPIPYKRQCDTYIRALSPGYHYHTCSAFNDDHVEDEGAYDIDWEADMRGEDQGTPLKKSKELLALKDECLTCPLFKFCNGCYKYIKDAKEQGEKFIEEHCQEMKSMQSELEELL